LAYRLPGWCAVTPSTKMSAACSWSLERILQAFFATQVEALVYFMLVILQCAPLAFWRALAGLWCCLQVSSVCWVGFRIPLHPVAKLQKRCSLGLW
jgi:hypothetical protein